MLQCTNSANPMAPSRTANYMEPLLVIVGAFRISRTYRPLPRGRWRWLRGQASRLLEGTLHIQVATGEHRLCRQAPQS
jgi:hypothetical protein